MCLSRSWISEELASSLRKLASIVTICAVIQVPLQEISGSNILTSSLGEFARQLRIFNCLRGMIVISGLDKNIMITNLITCSAALLRIGGSGICLRHDGHKIGAGILLWQYMHIRWPSAHWYILQNGKLQHTVQRIIFSIFSFLT